MKTFYKRFDFLLNLFLILSIIGAILFSLYSSTHGGFGNIDSIGGIVRKVSTILFLLIFILGFISLVVGIIFGIVGKRKKDKDSISFANRMIIHGIIKCIIAFVLFFVVNFVLSLFELNLSDAPGVPVSERDPNSSDTGFPIHDLKIVNKRPDADDQTSCDITVLNTNRTLSAANISVMVDDTENYYIFEQDHIAPEKTDIAGVNGSENTKDPCDATIIIYSAGIAKD